MSVSRKRIRAALMRLAWNFVAAATRQKIQIRARIGLHYALYVKLLVAAFHGVNRWLPLLTPPLQLVLRNIEVETPGFHV